MSAAVTKAGRRLLRTHRRLRAVVTVQSVAPSGGAIPSSETVKLVRARQHAAAAAR